MLSTRGQFLNAASTFPRETYSPACSFTRSFLRSENTADLTTRAHPCVGTAKKGRKEVSVCMRRMKLSVCDQCHLDKSGAEGVGSLKYKQHCGGKFRKINKIWLAKSFSAEVINEKWSREVVWKKSRDTRRGIYHFDHLHIALVFFSPIILRQPSSWISPMSPVQNHRWLFSSTK